MDDDELARRVLAAPASEYGSVRDLLEAIDESAAAEVGTIEPIRRYSNAGRPLRTLER